MSEEGTRSIDLTLLGTVLALVLIGVAMVYSASSVVAHNEFGDDLYFLLRHLMWLGVGLAGLLIATLVDYRRWQSLSVLGLVLCIAALALVLTPSFGERAYGAQRWLRLGPLPVFQPSEFVKLALVLYMASWLSRRGDRIGSLTHGSVPFALIIGLVATLVLAQPDVGTTAVIIAAAVSTFWVAGANLLHLLLGAIASIPIIVWVITTAAYRMDRLAAFLDPWSDLHDTGWHTVQTLIALGSGGIAGLGLGASRQKFYYLPNAHTDAILAIIGEELGFIGTIVVLALFAVVAWRGTKIAREAADGFGRLLAAGVTSLLVWQAVLNIAVVTNTLPYTGITLPFVSFGGSSLVVSLISTGMLLSISRSTSAPEMLPTPAATRAPDGQPRAHAEPRRRPTTPRTTAKKLGPTLLRQQSPGPGKQPSNRRRERR